MLDAGTYRAKAREAALGETDAGKEQVAVLFDLLDLQGQTINWYGYFTEKTEQSTIKALRTAGWTGTDLLDLSGLCPGSVEVYLVVEHETYTNPTTNETKTTAKVRWVNGAGGLSLKKALDPNKARAFAARMKGQITAYDRAAGTPKAPAPKRAPVTTPDDEQSPFNGDDSIPF
jgi:hypothetical protein